MATVNPVGDGGPEHTPMSLSLARSPSLSSAHAQYQQYDITSFTTFKVVFQANGGEAEKQNVASL